MSFVRPLAIRKQLSRNDTGETGGHQAGILVPKKGEVLCFFPKLDVRVYNPRLNLVFRDSLGKKWAFPFIYYNNKLFGGTRNEYRLTCMTPFFKAYNLKCGDTLLLSRDVAGNLEVGFERLGTVDEGERIKLGSSWKIVSF